MRKLRINLLICFVLLCGSSRAETVTIERPPGLIEVRIDTPADLDWSAVDIDWEARQPIDLPYLTFENGSVIVLYTTKNVVIQSDVIYWDLRKREKRTWVVDVGKPPGPTPDPGPDPDPDPDPGPDPPPFPAPGLAVVVVYETTATGNLPPTQRSIFTSSRVWDLLNQVCHKIDGQPLARKWDDDFTDSQLANSPTLLARAYREALDDAAGQLPWIIISNGVTGFSGPLPLTIDDTVSLIERYAD